MISWLCYLFWFLLGCLVGWLLNRLLVPAKVETVEKIVEKPVDRIVEKHVDNPAHVSRIAALEASLAAASVAGAAVAVKAAAKPAAKKAAPVKAAAVKAPAKKPAAKAAPVLNKDLAKSFGFNPRGMDDLEVIEGIGPKIKGLFHADGIKLFSELGATPVKKMQAILDAAGPRYKLANPSTWAAQAKLAATNKWEQLRKLQDELNAGVKK